MRVFMLSLAFHGFNIRHPFQCIAWCARQHTPRKSNTHTIRDDHHHYQRHLLYNNNNSNNDERLTQYSQVAHVFVNLANLVLLSRGKNILAEDFKYYSPGTGRLDRDRLVVFSLG